MDAKTKRYPTAAELDAARDAGIAVPDAPAPLPPVEEPPQEQVTDWSFWPLE